MHNKISQLHNVKYWLSWKLSSIGDYIYMVKSSLCIQTIDPLCISFHNQILSLISYDGLENLLIFFYSVIFNAPRDLLTCFQMWSLTALIFLPPWHRHCYVQFPWLDLAQAEAWFLVGEVLALYIQSAYWLKCAEK